MKKWIAALLCITLLLGLAACSQPASGQQAGGNTTIAEPDVFGMLVLNMNAIVNVSYDKDGLVLSISSENQLGDEIVAGMPKVLGSSCAKIVGDLITAIDTAAYAQEQKVILLKQATGSQAPSETFLQDILADAEKVAGGRAVVGAAVDTLTDEGYLSLDTAKELLAKQLGVEATALEGDPTVQDGLYWLAITQDDVTSSYSVDANLGAVEEQATDPVGDGDATEPSEDFYDPTMNQEITEATGFLEETIANDGDAANGIIFDEDATAAPTAESTEAAA